MNGINNDMDFFIAKTFLGFENFFRPKINVCLKSSPNHCFNGKYILPTVMNRR